MWSLDSQSSSKNSRSSTLEERLDDCAREVLSSLVNNVEGYSLSQASLMDFVRQLKGG